MNVLDLYISFPSSQTIYKSKVTSFNYTPKTEWYSNLTRINLLAVLFCCDVAVAQINYPILKHTR
jgi:hypothetical protein